MQSLLSVRASFAPLLAVIAGPIALAACGLDPPDTIAAAQAQFVPLEVDPHAEARAHNLGALYEFVADAAGYVSIPSELPAAQPGLRGFER